MRVADWSMISLALRSSTGMLSFKAVFISPNSSWYIRSNCVFRFSRSVWVKFTWTRSSASSPIGPYTVHPRGVLTAQVWLHSPSLSSSCLSIMSGRSLPIRMVTFLSPGSGKQMSWKWGHLLISSLVAMCFGVTGRLFVFKTCSSRNFTSPSRDSMFSWTSWPVVFSLQLIVVIIELVGFKSFNSNSCTRLSRQKVASDPLSRNAWVIISLVLQLPVILTGKTVKHTRGRLALTAPTVRGSLDEAAVESLSTGGVTGLTLAVVSTRGLRRSVTDLSAAPLSSALGDTLLLVGRGPFLLPLPSSEWIR